MSSLGRHIMVTTEQVQRLRALAEDEEEEVSPDEAVENAIEEMQEGLAEKYYFDTDKAWDPIHRTLTLDNTPGGNLDVDAGEHPLHLCFFGGEVLAEGGAYTYYLIAPDEVAELASALQAIDEAWFRKRFFQLDPKATLYDIDEDYLEYAWSNFSGLPDFFARAAAEGRAVIFSA
jgi:hypothetical protein